MKTIRRIIAALICLSMLMNVCISTVVAEEATPSEGLAFLLGPSKANYYVSGIGTCTDTEIVIPSTYKGLPVDSIVDGAFKDCASITSVIIPNSVESIGEEAFKNCSSLTSIEIPNSVKSIGGEAFSHCSSLTSIFMPASVTSIGAGVLTYCPSLGSIVVDKGNTVYHSSGHCLIDTAEKDLIAGCHKSVIPSDGSVKFISPHAFEGHTSITSITIPGSVLCIYESAFAYCTSLTSVTIENGLWLLGYKAFVNCTALTSINIPNSCEEIDPDVFSGCDVLSYNVYDNGKYLGNSDNPYFALVEPVSNDITQINIHNDTKIIGCDAFAGCNSIKSILFPDNVEKVYGLGVGIASLSAVGIASFASIYVMNPECELWWYFLYGPVTVYCNAGSWVENFYSGDNLIRLVTLESLNNGLAFTSNSGGASYSVIDIGDCTSNNVVIPHYYNNLPVISIGENAFANCTSLTNITIPDSITSIGSGAFSYCDSLTSIIISDSVANVGNDAFVSCDSLTSIYVMNPECSIYAHKDTLGVPGITTIYGYANSTAQTYAEAFGYQFVEIGKSGEELSFSWNSGDNEPSLQVYGSSSYTDTDVEIPHVYRNFVVTRIPDNAFEKNPITSITIPNSVTSIGDEAFRNCTSLTSVTIPDSITSIGYEAFYNCTSLTSVTIPDSITSIKDYTFNGCKSLTSVAIPDRVTLIDFSAFRDCTALTDVYYTGTEAEWAAITIYNNNDPLLNATIHFAEEETTVEITVNNVGNETSGAVITAPEGGWVIGSNTFTIACDKVCFAVVSYDNGATYTRIASTVAGEAHSFTAEITDASTIISVVVAGDTNGDGAISNADSTRLSAAYAGKVDIDALQSIAADVNGDGEITNADITKLRAAYAEKTQLTW